MKRRVASWLAVWAAWGLFGGLAAAYGAAEDGLGAAPSDYTDTLDPCYEEVTADAPRCRWYGRVEALMLFRDSEGNIPLAAQGGAQNPVFGTRDLDFAFKAGPKVLIGRTLNDSWQFEASYFDVDQWNTSAAIRDANSELLSPLSHFGTPVVSPVLDHNDLISVQYKTYLNNVEMNLRYTVDMPPGRMTTSFLLGTRYTGLREEMQFFSHGTGGNNFVQVNTQNDLFGVQIGGLFEFFVQDDWWINFEMKGAICNNSTTLRVGSDVLQTATHDTSAFIGELDLVCVHRWGNHVSTRVGYQALWLEHMAIAYDNFQSNVNFIGAGPLQVNNHGNAVFHGPHVGVDVMW